MTTQQVKKAIERLEIEQKLLVERREYLKRTAEEIKEHIGAEKIRVDGADFVILPAEIFRGYMEMYSAWNAMCSVWNRYVNDEVEKSFGLELYKYISPKVHRPKLYDWGIALLQSDPT